MDRARSTGSRALVKRGPEGGRGMPSLGGSESRPEEGSSS